MKYAVFVCMRVIRHWQDKGVQSSPATKGEN